MSITLNFAQATRLLDAFGGAPAQMTVSAFSEGHSGPGLYVHCADYPEEGSTFLGEADADPSEQPEAGKSRVVITLTDEDDTVDVSLKFVTPFEKAARTGAQSMAVTMINAIKEEVLDVEVSPGGSGEVVHG